MAQRLNQSEAWLSRYLDLARLPAELMIAFPDPFELKISHVGTLKPILKPAASRARVLAEAPRPAQSRTEGAPNVPTSGPDVLRAPAAAGEAPRGDPNKGAPHQHGRPEGRSVGKECGSPSRPRCPPEH